MSDWPTCRCGCGLPVKPAPYTSKLKNADAHALLVGAVGITAQPSHPIGTHVRSTVPGYPWKGVLVKPDPDLPECPYKVKWQNGMVEACLEDEIVVLHGVVS